MLQQSLYNIKYVLYIVLIFFSLENGDVYVWGSNNERQLGMDTINDSANIRIPTIVPINHPVVFISCGHNHTAFVTSRLPHVHAQYTTRARSNLT
jgi:alpha-tubulin suppressor-like RCC1 family protein